MDTLVKYLNTQDYRSLRSIDRSGNTICVLTKDCKYGGGPQQFTLTRDVYGDTFFETSDAARAFVYCSGNHVAAYGVGGKCTLYKYDHEDKYHCDMTCLSFTRHDHLEYTPLRNTCFELHYVRGYSSHTMQMHTVFQLVQGGMICEYCYDSKVDGPSLKRLYELWYGMKQWSEARLHKR